MGTLVEDTTAALIRADRFSARTVSFTRSCISGKGFGSFAYTVSAIDDMVREKFPACAAATRDDVHSSFRVLESLKPKASMKLASMSTTRENFNSTTSLSVGARVGAVVGLGVVGAHVGRAVGAVVKVGAGVAVGPGVVEGAGDGHAEGGSETVGGWVGVLVVGPKVGTLVGAVVGKW